MVESPKYRIVSRDYDYSIRELVPRWESLDLDLKYCDISTCQLTMDTADFITYWWDDDKDPGTEGTWLTNYTAGTAKERGTGVIIYRGEDVLPIFNGIITDVNRVKEAGISDIVTLTFSSDEILLSDYICYPDCGAGVHPACTMTGQYEPGALTGIWGPYHAGPPAYGDQWEKICQKQETNIKGFLRDNIGGNAVAWRQITQLKIEADAGAGVTVCWTGKLNTVLEMAQAMAITENDVSQTYPYDEVRFWIEQMGTPSAGYCIELKCRQAPRKETNIIFSEKLGTISKIEYEEHRPEVNRMLVCGPFDNEFRVYAFVTGWWADLSATMYGSIEGTCDKSDASGVNRADTLSIMKTFGFKEVNPKLFNVNAKVTITESNFIKMSPDASTSNFWIGDYVRAELDYGFIQDLIREITIRVDGGGEEITAVVCSSQMANKDWWTMGTRVRGMQRAIKRLSVNRGTTPGS